MRFFSRDQFVYKFNFVAKTLIKQSREEMESFLDQYHILKDQKERKMILTGFEQACYDRGVEAAKKRAEETIKESIEKTRENVMKTLENFIENNKDLDKDEFVKKLKELKFEDSPQSN